MAFCGILMELDIQGVLMIPKVTKVHVREAIASVEHILTVTKRRHGPGQRPSAEWYF